MSAAVELARGPGEVEHLESLSRVLLSLDEVRAVGRPAFFVDWGEALLFHDGQLFDVRDLTAARRAGRPPEPLPPKVLEAGVGIDYGWRHAAGCDCRACQARRTTPRERAWRPPAAVARANSARAAGSARRR